MQDERVAVFEEDARLDSASAARFKALYKDLSAEPWYRIPPSQYRCNYAKMGARQGCGAARAWTRPKQ